MAKIDEYLSKLLSAIYGKDVRQAIHDSISEINNESTNTKNTVGTFDNRIKQLENAGSGLSNEAKTLLIAILRNAIYSTNQSANIALLETALSSGGSSSGGSTGGDSGGSESGTQYRVTNNLTNVTNSNAVVTVAENAMYIATLTANTGYAIDSVTVTMGGVDVTATAYSGGSVTIASVTGNIVITASAVESDVGTSYVQSGLLHEFTDLTTSRTIAGGQSIFNSENDFTVFASCAGKSVDIIGDSGAKQEFFFQVNWQGKFISQVYLTDSSAWPQIIFAPSDTSGEVVYRSCIVKSGNGYSLYVDGETNPVSTMGSNGNHYILDGDLVVNKSNKPIDKVLIYNRALSETEINKNFTAISLEVGA